MARDVFPFLKLPLELRLRIYKYSLTRDEPLCIPAAWVASSQLTGSRDDDAGDSSESAHPHREDTLGNPDTAAILDGGSCQVTKKHQSPTTAKRPPNTAVLRLNKAIHGEAIKILYSENTFKVWADTAGITLRALRPFRSFVKYIDLSVCHQRDLVESLGGLVMHHLRYIWYLTRVRVVFPDFLRFEDWYFYLFDNGEMRESLAGNLCSLPPRATVVFTGAGSFLQMDMSSIKKHDTEDWGRLGLPHVGF